ncbi:MAG: TasA family protein [Bacilli bacterium]
MNRENKILFGVCLGIMFLISVSTSYGYFSSTIRNDSVKDQVVTTGTLSLRYVDGAEINMQNITPGATVTKTVYVANTGTLNATYNLVWQELVNEITNDEMLIEGICTRLDGTSESVSGTCNNISSTPISSNVIKSAVSIEPNIIHKYDLTITFKEANASQNYNQSKKFSGVIGVKESTTLDFSSDSWNTIISNVKAGKGSSYEVGATKEVTLSTLGTHTIRVANNTSPSECSTSGFSQTACGFVLEFADIITTHSMDSSSVGGWNETALYTYLNNTIYNELPNNLKNSIINTTVVSSPSIISEEHIVSTDKMYLLAPSEIYSDWNDEYDISKNLTRQLDYYKQKGTSTSSNSSALKSLGSTNTGWWTRSADHVDAELFFEVFSAGNCASSSVSSSSGVSPAFRIG